MNVLNSLSPKYRLLCAVAVSLVISQAKSVNFLLILTACIALWVLFLHSHQPKNLLKRWLKFNLFSLLIWLTLSWKIGTNGIELNANGIELAKLITLRMNAIVLATWLLLHHVTDTIWVQAISQLPLPKKLIHLFILTVRYISILSDLNDKMDIAMKARGFRPQCNLWTMKVYAQRIALLLILAINKAEKAEMALKARGFKF